MISKTANELETLEQESTYYPPCQDCNKKMDEIRRIYDKIKEQEPCDAISREYLKKIAQSEGAYGYVSAHDIATAPSVTQKSGKWIETEYHRWRCSVCREKGTSEWDNIHDVRTNFCPNCGAKMESEDKE